MIIIPEDYSSGFFVPLPTLLQTLRMYRCRDRKIGTGIKAISALDAKILKNSFAILGNSLTEFWLYSQKAGSNSGAVTYV